MKGLKGVSQEPSSILAAKELHLGIVDMPPVLRALHKGSVIVYFAQRLGYLRDAEIPVGCVDGFRNRLDNVIRGNVLQLEILLQSDPPVAFGWVAGHGGMLFSVPRRRLPGQSR